FERFWRAVVLFSGGILAVAGVAHCVAPWPVPAGCAPALRVGPRSAGRAQYLPVAVAATSRMRARHPRARLAAAAVQDVAAAWHRTRRATRQPMVAAPSRTSDAIRNAAPGCGSHASGPIDTAYTPPKNS